MLNQVKIVIGTHKFNFSRSLRFLGIRHIRHFWKIHQHRIGTCNTLEIVVPEIIERGLIWIQRGKVFIVSVLHATVGTFPGHVSTIFG